METLAPRRSQMKIAEIFSLFIRLRGRVLMAPHKAAPTGAKSGSGDHLAGPTAPESGKAHKGLVDAWIANRHH